MPAGDDVGMRTITYQQTTMAIAQVRADAETEIKTEQKTESETELKAGAEITRSGSLAAQVCQHDTRSKIVSVLNRMKVDGSRDLHSVREKLLDMARR